MRGSHFCSSSLRSQAKMEEVIKMPMRDKTGPRGMGPGTGRGMGLCGGGAAGALGRGRGYGRVMCGWFWRNFQEMPKEEKRKILKEEAEDLKKELGMIEKEMEGLEE